MNSLFRVALVVMFWPMWAFAKEPVTVNGITFDSPLVEVDAGPADNSITVDFAFENTSDKRVFFNGLEVHCSCLAGDILPKRLYPDGVAPGEKGMIRTVFDLGQFQGTVEKTIGVHIGPEKKDVEKGMRAPMKLSVRVKVPVLFVIEPKTLIWELGGEAKQQSFDITVEHESPINILKHSMSSKVFPYEVEVVEPGRKYRVSVTPKSVENGGVAVLTFRTDCDIKKHRNKQAFVVIRKPIPKPR